jgi:RNA polymerase sigma factor (sigma-70 family)
VEACHYRSLNLVFLNEAERFRVFLISDQTQNMEYDQQQAVRKDSSVGLEDETDVDLLTYMSWRSEDAAAAQAAGTVFYNRHVRYLYGVCRNAARKFFLNEDYADDLVADTFLRVYERAETFSADGIADPKQLQLRVHAWMGAIANNVLRDMLRGSLKAPQKHLDTEAWADQPNRVPPEESADVTLVRRAMEEVLDEREREVIRVTFLFYKPEAEQQRLSNADTAALAAALQTTSDNLRKIRRKALSKIRDYLITYRTDTNADRRHSAEVKP